MTEACGVGVLQIRKKCGFILIRLGWVDSFFSYWKDPVYETCIQARGCSSFRNAGGLGSLHKYITLYHHGAAQDSFTGSFL